MSEKYGCVHLNAGNCPFYPNNREDGEVVRKSLSTGIVYFEKDSVARFKGKFSDSPSAGCAVLDRYNLASEGRRNCMHLDTFVTSQLSLEVMAKIWEDIKIQTS